MPQNFEKNPNVFDVTNDIDNVRYDFFFFKYCDLLRKSELYLQKKSLAGTSSSYFLRRPLKFTKSSP